MPIHIVHLEDEIDLRNVFAEVIAIMSSDVNLQQFSNADDVLDYVRNYGKTVNVFVLDIRVPGQLNGLELAAKIRELGCYGRIIITSAYQMPPVALLESLRAEYMGKPWDAPEFFTKILDSKPD